MAAPNFTSLEGFCELLFFQKHTFICSFWLRTHSRQQRQHFDVETLQTPFYKALAGPFQPGSFALFPLLFPDLRWLRRYSHLTPQTPPANRYGGFGCKFHFIASLLSFSSLTNMVTQTWQKHLIPAGRRSGCAAA